VGFDGAPAPHAAVARVSLVEQDGPSAARIACAEIGDREIRLAVPTKIGDGDLHGGGAAGNRDLVLEVSIAQPRE